VINPAKKGKKDKNIPKNNPNFTINGYAIIPDINCKVKNK
jgi:hypothetical protein